MNGLWTVSLSLKEFFHQSKLVSLHSKVRADSSTELSNVLLSPDSVSEMTFNGPMDPAYFQVRTNLIEYFSVLLTDNNSWTIMRHFRSPMSINSQTTFAINESGDVLISHLHCAVLEERIHS